MGKPITLTEQYEHLKKYQRCGWVHPLTCCDHQVMFVNISKGFPLHLLLECPRCGRIQKDIPDCVWDVDVDNNPMDMFEPRAYTEEECKQMLIHKLDVIADYWEKETRSDTISKKIRGAIFSILVVIDGEDGNLPGFKLIPNPASSDRGYHISRGENWWPDDCDLGGSLHEKFS